MLANQLETGNLPYPNLIRKYSSGHPLDHYRRGINERIGMLERRLAAQKEKGSPYLVGPALSAADLYWVTFSNLIEPLPPEDCVMPEFFYDLFGKFSSTYLEKPLPASLLEHRAYIVEKYVDTPIAM